MVKINLLRKDTPAEEEFRPVEETAAETPEPEKKEKARKTKKKGGSLKLILIILMVGAIGGSGYLAYSEGWFSGGDDSRSVDTLVIADETPMDSPSESGENKTVKKPQRKKLSTLNTKSKPAQTKPKSKRPAAKRRSPAANQKGTGLTQVVEGRILLDVFNSIVTSIGDGMSNMKLTVSNSGVTLALGMNSREDAAFLLRNIRQKWPLSNLRAVRFERPNLATEYKYATQFNGSVQFKDAIPSSGNKRRKTLSTASFKEQLSELMTTHGLSLIKFRISSEIHMRGRTTIPVIVTAVGSNKSITDFIESLAKLDVAYAMLRASLLSKDSAASTVSLYLNLIKSDSKGLS